MTPLAAVLLVDPVPADCSLVEDDYIEIRRALLARRRTEPFAVRADNPRCQRALEAVLRNAPLLRLSQASSHVCTLVLRPAPDGWAFDLEGPCVEGEERAPLKRGVRTRARPPLYLDFEPESPIVRAAAPAYSFTHCVDPKLRLHFSEEMASSVDQVR